MKTQAVFLSAAVLAFGLIGAGCKDSSAPPQDSAPPAAAQSAGAAPNVGIPAPSPSASASQASGSGLAARNQQATGKP